MKRFLAVGAFVGSAMLVLAGCSSSPSDSDATENAADLGDATEDAAGVGGLKPAIELKCEGKTKEIPIPKDDNGPATSVTFYAVGAGGWALESDPSADEQGMGGSVKGTATLSKSDGDTLYANVGCEAANENTNSGYPNGGTGDGAGNHGGGGSTGLYRDGGAATDPSNPIVIAGGGGGAPRGGKFAGGSVGPGGIGEAGDGPMIEGKPGCGGGGATQDKPGAAVPVSNYGNPPWQGRDGKDNGRGGGVQTGDVNGPGGAGGGGYKGGASGCAANLWCSGCLGAGGAGSSYADSVVQNPTYGTQTTNAAGYLGLTFLCGPDASPCATQPTPSVASR
jgi:hypothetical protein